MILDEKKLSQMLGMFLFLMSAAKKSSAQMPFDDYHYFPGNICYADQDALLLTPGICTAPLDFDEFGVLALSSIFFLTAAGLSYLCTEWHFRDRAASPVSEEPPPSIYVNLNELLAADRLSETAGISGHLKDYLATIEKSAVRPKNLTDAQHDPLAEGHDELVCSISGRLKDMPVTVYGEPYDFSTVIVLPMDEQGRRTHPKTRELFQLIEVQADRPAREAIKNHLEHPKPAYHTHYPAFFTRRDIKSNKATWPKIVNAICGQEKNKAISVLTQLRDYSRERGRTYLEEKAEAAITSLKRTA